MRGRVKELLSMREETAKKVLWILLILNMAVIFLLSSQPADVSTVESDILVALPQNLYEVFHPGSIDDFQVYQVIQFIIRKTAHVMEFTTLSLWIAGLLLLYRVRCPYLLSAILGGLYAVSDELHQTLVPGREGKLTDWGFDFAGVLIGILLAYLIMRHRNRQTQSGGT